MTDHIEKHILQRYEPIKKIGSGAFGIVWKVIDRRDRSTHALKKNFDAFQNSTDAQRTYRQVQFLRKLNHPNIVHLERIYKSQNKKDMYLVFDFMDIDLYVLIRENLLGEKHKRYISYQVAKALFYLHSAELVHRDIKPSNILVNENCEAKVCDFGLIRSVGDQTEANPILTEYIATRWYRAPQILLGSQKYTKAIDVWSFGCMLGQMIKGKPFFPGNSTLNQIQRVLTWTGPPSLSDIKALKTDFGREMLDLLSKIKPYNKKEWFQSCPEDALDLLTRTLEFNPQKRYTMLDILKHPYFQEFYEPQELFVAKEKIKIKINDDEKLTLQQYRQLLYKQVEIEEQHESPIKIYEGKQKQAQVCKHNVSASKSIFRNRAYNKQVRSATKDKQKFDIISNNVSLNCHKNSGNNSRLAYQVYSRKNSLTVGNSVGIKKNYGSIGDKNKKKLSQPSSKHVKTENDHIATQSNFMNRKRSKVYKNIIQTEDELYDEIKKSKKQSYDYQKKRKSEVIGRYMYKNRKI